MHKIGNFSIGEWFTQQAEKAHEGVVCIVGQPLSGKTLHLKHDYFGIGTCDHSILDIFVYLIGGIVFKIQIFDKSISLKKILKVIGMSSLKIECNSKDLRTFTVETLLQVAKKINRSFLSAHEIGTLLGGGKSKKVTKNNLFTIPRNYVKKLLNLTNVVCYLAKDYQGSLILLKQNEKIEKDTEAMCIITSKSSQIKGRGLIRIKGINSEVGVNVTKFFVHKDLNGFDSFKDIIKKSDYDIKSVSSVVAFARSVRIAFNDGFLVHQKEFSLSCFTVDDDDDDHKQRENHFGQSFQNVKLEKELFSNNGESSTDASSNEEEEEEEEETKFSITPRKPENYITTRKPTNFINLVSPEAETFSTPKSKKDRIVKTEKPFSPPKPKPNKKRIVKIKEKDEEQKSDEDIEMSLHTFLDLNMELFSKENFLLSKIMNYNTPLNYSNYTISLPTSFKFSNNFECLSEEPHIPVLFVEISSLVVSSLNSSSGLQTFMLLLRNLLNESEIDVSSISEIYKVFYIINDQNGKREIKNEILKSLTYSAGLLDKLSVTETYYNLFQKKQINGVESKSDLDKILCLLFNQEIASYRIFKKILLIVSHGKIFIDLTKKIGLKYKIQTGKELSSCSSIIRIFTQKSFSHYYFRYTALRSVYKKLKNKNLSPLVDIACQRSGCFNAISLKIIENIEQVKSEKNVKMIYDFFRSNDDAKKVLVALMDIAEEKKIFFYFNENKISSCSDSTFFETYEKKVSHAVDLYLKDVKLSHNDSYCSPKDVEKSFAIDSYSSPKQVEKSSTDKRKRESRIVPKEDDNLKKMKSISKLVEIDINFTRSNQKTFSQSFTFCSTQTYREVLDELIGRYKNFLNADFIYDLTFPNGTVVPYKVFIGEGRRHLLLVEKKKECIIQ